MRFLILFALCIPVIANAMKPTVGPDASMILGGEEGDSCKIIMCLSDPIGQDIAECIPPLTLWEKTDPKDRPGLLSKCPKVSDGSEK